MKIYYKRLSKEERKKAKKEYYDTENGQYLKKLNRWSCFCIIICILWCLYLLIEGIIMKHTGKIVYAIIFILIPLSFIPIIKKNQDKRINNYLVKNKKK